MTETRTEPRSSQQLTVAFGSSSAPVEPPWLPWGRHSGACYTFIAAHTNEGPVERYGAGWPL